MENAQSMWWQTTHPFDTLVKQPDPENILQQLKTIRTILNTDCMILSSGESKSAMIVDLREQIGISLHALFEHKDKEWYEKPGKVLLRPHQTRMNLDERYNDTPMPFPYHTLAAEEKMIDVPNHKAVKPLFHWLDEYGLTVDDQYFINGITTL